ncbi:DUF1549 and DUF1553 domain-containing protein [Alienimonas californiensis]|uniref:DUF1549 domain-containing protein n=1 Tax=Alienimonas californiensis TaxID=2527989 RepID=A0A517PA31_9PLAN|nr:DUF1549 and DUF1553 domain-containing protein [Alienimonas californiensis]QDT16233.1 hypothetical protein CA12_23330 [Alienimonas californiensis]
MTLRPLAAAFTLALVPLLSAPGASVGAAFAAEAGGEPVRGNGDAAIIAEIDRLIARSWEDNGVEPSPVASDSEWLRRVWLDLGGHIPDAETVQAFERNKSETKRAEMIQTLLESPDYVRHFSTVWTNLAIGQGEPENTSRLGMRRFFRNAFARNVPWSEVVFELITAEGHFEENGATNFLLAQMVDNDEGVQATAKATRLLLGMQVQCTQCHNHPFNDWKQDQFWQFNSILKAARRVDHEEFDQQTGQNEFVYAELLRRPLDGPVFFEKRSGLMQVAFPEAFGAKFGEDAGTDRRTEFATALTGLVPDEEGFPSASESADAVTDQIARAFVNRTWGHFHGYGFTKPVDDMGPHNPASHPELLDFLTAKFVEHNYDVRRLITWIANSQAYGLTSQSTKENEFDDPAAGELPLFSHMAVKRMTAEQLYDSLLIATEAQKAGNSDWEAIERQKREWLGQFITAFGTDDLTESTTFNGSIPQALMMMNGELTSKAISAEPGSYLNRVLGSTNKPEEAVDRLFLAALGRQPTSKEKTAAAQLIRGSEKPIYGYQDLFWALLNSNEFVFVK